MPSTVFPLRITLLLLMFLCVVMNYIWVRPQIKRLQLTNTTESALRELPKTSDLIMMRDVDPPPRIQEIPGGLYYDVTLHLRDSWDTLIIDHWFSTIPAGITTNYPESAPRIFFHGRDSDPFDVLARDGYLHDSDGFQSLWTVAVTDNNSNIQLTKGPFVYRYLVVFKLKNTRNRITVEVMSQNVPQRLKEEKRIIARVWDKSEHHPDAYIFTKEAQKEENNPLEIIRVYHYHVLSPFQ